MSKTVHLTRVTRNPGDWPEDFDQDNGCYRHTCCVCKEGFVGHKRRHVCKVCFEQDRAEAEKRAEWLHNHKAPKDWTILTVQEVKAMYADVSRQTWDLVHERSLRRELAQRLQALIDCIMDTRGPDAYAALEGGKDSVAKSTALDAKIAANEAKRLEG